MTEQNFTPEQIAAWQTIESTPLLGSQFAEAVTLLKPLLPDSITNPKHGLPTEPGWYQGFDKVAQSQVTIRLADNGNWGYGITGSTLLANPERFGPFSPLVPERPQVTVDEIQSAITNIVRSRSFSAARLLSDIHVEDLATKLHAALVNGDPR